MKNHILPRLSARARAREDVITTGRPQDTDHFGEFDDADPLSLFMHSNRWRRDVRNLKSDPSWVAQSNFLTDATVASIVYVHTTVKVAKGEGKIKRRGGLAHPDAVLYGLSGKGPPLAAFDDVIRRVV